MEVLKFDYSFYTCLTDGGVIEVLNINYSSYTHVVNGVVINLIFFRFPRKVSGGFRTNFKTLGSPKIGRS